MSSAEVETDSLAHLEARVTQAIEVITRLRAERDTAVKERDAAVAAADQAKGELTRLAEENRSLQAERKQVRTRVEKLLSQISQASAG